ncbi:MAG: DegV family protein [Clostridia bacterium]|nr:DegV family protein [Clostridia bacterium]
MSVFFCDSNCELWYDKVEALGIKFISMPYTIDGQEYYYDLGKNTDNKEFFDKMRKGASAKTSALNMNDYMDIFEPVLASGEDALYVSFSHKMSGTFNSLNLAKEELLKKYPERKITVVDTENISMGAGIIVYYAAKLHNEGASDEEVVKFVEEFREKVRIYFTVGDLEYLKRGGRLTSFKALMGTLLNLKPIIECVNGKLENIEKAKGRKKSIFTLIDYLERDEIDTSYPVAIINADSPEDEQIIYDTIKEKYPDVEIWRQLVGPVIGSHCGPDTLGIIFIAK